ncbi:dihydrofolate reductase family protein [uncultured Agrococcus sp.]|uniref:dihydrofolate reductase family protein n=1 Tax=uncultured Agrococcus sp. TaxID=382258 RepID=UPI0025EAB8EA|nr:dihydrofolate reductase family protein [uncultured Agrococcus sp.]
MTAVPTEARIVTAGFHMSLDGFIARPGGELDWLRFGPDVIEHAADTMRGIDTMFLGRHTYLAQAAHWPNQTGELADAVNNHEKIVFTSHPETLVLTNWPGSRASRSPAAEIEAIRSAPGKRIGVSGGARLFRTMLRDGLIDEIRVIIHPVTLRAGVSPWSGSLGFTLASTEEFDSGAVLHTYAAPPRPTSADSH